MRSLIVPMAGRSTRFPKLRPKWMLSHPMTNRLMVTEAISGLNLDFFDNIYFLCLQEHEDKYSFMKGFCCRIRWCWPPCKIKHSIIAWTNRFAIWNCLYIPQWIWVRWFYFIKDSDGFYRCDVEEEIKLHTLTWMIWMISTLGLRVMLILM